MHRYYRDYLQPYQENVDFKREAKDRQSPLMLLAPHAGGIEPGTGKLAKAIAGDRHSFYIFEGLKTTGNKALHIPSTAFYDPLCSKILAHTEIALSIHGCRGDEPLLYVGGLHQTLINMLLPAFQKEGFQAQHHHPRHAGTDAKNICNRCLTKKGVQIELSYGLRDTFFKKLDRPGREHPTERFYHFVRVIQECLHEVVRP